MVSNFAGVEKTGHQLALPREGVWQEVLNTDATDHGGRGAGNLGMVVARGRENGDPIATVTLPALSTLWLRHQPEPHVPTVNHG